MQQDNVPQKAPISAHPAFPWLVGLWFAALFGLGTMVLPSSMLDKATRATGLSAVFSDGLAHAFLVLVATAFGLFVGLALARRIADALGAVRTPRLRDSRKGRSQPPRPLSVHDDIGEAAIAAPAEELRKPLPGRRRALAVAEELPAVDLPFDAPLPGDDAVPPPPLPVDDGWASQPSAEFSIPAFRGEPEEALDLSGLIPTAEPEPEAPEPYVPPFDTRKPRDIAAPPLVEPVSPPRKPQPIDAPLEDLGIVQLTERLGRAMQLRANARKAQAAAEAPTFPALSFEQETAQEPQGEASFVPPPVVPDALRAFMDSPLEDAVPAPRPFSFTSFEDDDDEDDGIDVFAPRPFGLSLSAMRPGEFDSADDSEDDAEEAGADGDGSFSSLLSMKTPFRTVEDFAADEDEDETDEEAEEQSFAAYSAPATEEPEAPAPAVAEEPATGEADLARPFDALQQPVAAPARSGPDPVETERALRSALANLQRMSGAA